MAQAQAYAEAVNAAEMRQEAEEYVLNGMTQQELESALRDMFDAADVDGSGTIGLKELRSVLAQMGVNLSDAELNAVLFNLDTNKDGMLSIQEFLPVAFEMLVNVVMDFREHAMMQQRAQAEAEIETQEKAQDIADATGMSLQQLSETLEGIFIAHDADGNGVLDQSEFARCISELGNQIGIDRRVAAQIFRAVDVNGDGVVEWHEFVQPAVQIIHSSMAQAQAYAEAVNAAEMRQEAEEYVLNGMTQQELESALRDMFDAADVDGSGTIGLKE